MTCSPADPADSGRRAETASCRSAASHIDYSSPVLTEKVKHDVKSCNNHNMLWLTTQTHTCTNLCSWLVLCTGWYEESEAILSTSSSCLYSPHLQEAAEDLVKREKMKPKQWYISQVDVSVSSVSCRCTCTCWPSLSGFRQTFVPLWWVNYL